MSYESSLNKSSDYLAVVICEYLLYSNDFTMSISNDNENRFLILRTSVCCNVDL